MSKVQEATKMALPRVNWQKVYSETFGGRQDAEQPSDNIMDS